MRYRKFCDHKTSLIEQLSAQRRVSRHAPLSANDEVTRCTTECYPSECLFCSMVLGTFDENIAFASGAQMELYILESSKLLYEESILPLPKTIFFIGPDDDQLHRWIVNFKSQRNFQNEVNSWKKIHSLPC